MIFYLGFNRTGPWPAIKTQELLMLVGSVNYQESDSSGIFIRSHKVYPHPSYSNPDIWSVVYDDIALIEVGYLENIPTYLG